MNRSIYIWLVIFISISACSEPEMYQDVPFKMMPDGLKKSIEAELIEKMENEVIEHHQELDEIYASGYFETTCSGIRNFLELKRNAAGRFMSRGEIIPFEESTGLVSMYYLANESLSIKETRSNIQDPSYQFNELPFYSRLTKSEILNGIEENKRELERSIEADEGDFIVFYQDLVSKWEQKLEAIEVLDTEELIEIHPEAQITIKDDLNFNGLSTLTTKAIKGLIQVRDHASKKYFNLSYLELYFQATRFITPEADKKLSTIDFLYPIKITDYSYAKLNGLKTDLVLEELPLDFETAILPVPPPLPNPY